MKNQGKNLMIRGVCLVLLTGVFIFGPVAVSDSMQGNRAWAQSTQADRKPLFIPSGTISRVKSWLFGERNGGRNNVQDQQKSFFRPGAKQSKASVPQAARYTQDDLRQRLSENNTGQRDAIRAMRERNLEIASARYQDYLKQAPPALSGKDQRRGMAVYTESGRERPTRVQTYKRQEQLIPKPKKVFRDYR